MAEAMSEQERLGTVEQEGADIEVGRQIIDDASDKPGRARSQIQFPYGDLAGAIELVKAITTNGAECDQPQLAAWMGHDSVSSGTFRVKLATARIFGLVEVAEARVSLTTLGRRIVDPNQERNAKVDAFLEVPLYRAVYDKYKGFLLPKDVGLENEMVRLGVPPKQKAKARLAFQRSADQAGLFDTGKEHLVLPKGYGSKQPATDTPPPPGVRHEGDGGTGRGDALKVPPAIRGMLSLLPAEGAKWTPTQQQLWIGALTQILDFIYRGEPEAPARTQASATENHKAEMSE